MKVYFSVDIETDGVVAGRNNMISLGIAALDMHSGKIIAKFKRNLETVSDLRPDADTMQWWKKFPEAYAKARAGAVPPAEAIQEAVNFILGLATIDSIVFAWKPVMDLDRKSTRLNSSH